jgi:hypothetical protein
MSRTDSTDHALALRRELDDARRRLLSRIAAYERRPTSHGLVRLGRWVTAHDEARSRLAAFEARHGTPGACATR